MMRGLDRAGEAGLSCKTRPTRPVRTKGFSPESGLAAAVVTAMTEVPSQVAPIPASISHVSAAISPVGSDVFRFGLCSGLVAGADVGSSLRPVPPNLPRILSDLPPIVPQLTPILADFPIVLRHIALPCSGRHDASQQQHGTHPSNPLHDLPSTQRGIAHTVVNCLDGVGGGAGCSAIALARRFTRVRRCEERPVTMSEDVYLVTTLKLLRPSSSGPRATTMFTVHVPLIESCPTPRYRPADSWVSVAELRMAGMFIAGIAGMMNTTVTVASVTGEPSGPLTVTATPLSPAFGGSGSLRKSMATPFESVWTPAVGGVF